MGYVISQFHKFMEGKETKGSMVLTSLGLLKITLVIQYMLGKNSQVINISSLHLVYESKARISA